MYVLLCFCGRVKMILQKQVLCKWSRIAHLHSNQWHTQTELGREMLRI